jgi:aryl-alcohol dehydrogenase-like predicted oxidoreductase
MNQISTDLHCPITQSLGFGTAAISSMRSYGKVMQLLRAAYEGGIRYFDTAPLYGRGYAEKLLGDFIRDKRSHVTIATKFGLGNVDRLPIPSRLALPLNYYRKKWGSSPLATGLPAEDQGPVILPYRRISLEEVKGSLENSLGRLQTDYIDYYLLHEALPGFLDPGGIEFLLSQKEQGRIRYLGVATGAYNLDRLTPSDLQQWDVIQYEAGSLNGRLKEKHPDKQHFLHSVLKNIGKYPPDPEIQPDDAGGFLLARQTKMNAGKILFSTRRKKVLQNNLLSFKKFSTEDIR